MRMQRFYDGCLSTRLDTRKAVVRDENKRKNTDLLILREMIGKIFSLYSLENPLYLQKWSAAYQF